MEVFKLLKSFSESYFILFRKSREIKKARNKKHSAITLGHGLLVWKSGSFYSLVFISVWSNRATSRKKVSLVWFDPTSSFRLPSLELSSKRN